jgi:Family of unknown function (DUF6504)
MPERFISEEIKPVVATIDTSRMAAGEPGLPREFVWRGETIKVVAVIRAWHETGRCSHGSPENYVRKHWFEVTTASHGTLKIYFERQPRRGQKGGRWRLFTIDGPEEARKEPPSPRQPDS